MADNERRKALDAALQNLTKRFGDGTILRLGDTQRTREIPPHRQATPPGSRTAPSLPKVPPKPPEET